MYIAHANLYFINPAKNISFSAYPTFAGFIKLYHLLVRNQYPIPEKDKMYTSCKIQKNYHWYTIPTIIVDKCEGQHHMPKLQQRPLTPLPIKKKITHLCT
jgi:hypothetical protein